VAAEKRNPGNDIFYGKTETMNVTRKSVLVGLLSLSAMPLSGCNYMEREMAGERGQEQGEAEERKKYQEREKKEKEERDKQGLAERNRRDGERFERQRNSTPFSSSVRNDGAVRASYVGQTEFGNGIDRSELTLD